MVACFRIGAVALPCTEQLRAGDLRGAHGRGRAPRWWSPTSATPATVARGRLRRAAAARARRARCSRPTPAPAVDLAPDDPALIVFTSGTAGEPKPIRHGQRYLDGPARSRPSTGSAPGRATSCWCTAASGLVEVGPQRLHRAVAARRRRRCSHDARFDPDERLEVDRARGRRRALHGADRVPGDRQARRRCGRCPALRHAVAAGEPLNPEVVDALAGGGGRRRSTTATARPRPAR